MTGIISYRFDNFEVNLTKRELVHSGEAVRIVPKAFDTLLALIEERDRIIRKDELFLKVWQGQIIDENNLNQKISMIRKALGEKKSGKKYILTVPGHGYRFTGQVEEVVETSLSLGRGPDRPGHPPASVAILPFAVHDETGGAKELGLDLADSLITRIARIRRITVGSTALIAGFPSDMDPITAGRKLNFESILYGRVKMADSCRVTLQLVSSLTGSILWTAEINSARQAPQNQIEDLTDSIYPVLREYLQYGTRDISSEISESGYIRELCMLGQYLCNKRIGSYIRKGIKYFEQAVILDPGHAPAHAGLALAQMLLGFYDSTPAAEILPAAEAAADKAVSLDPKLAQAYAARAFIRMAYKYDAAGAGTDFAQAIKLNPGDKEVGLWYSRYLSAMGMRDQAVAHIMKIRQREPLSISAGADAGLILYFAGHLDEAEREVFRTIDIEPDYAPARLQYALILEQKGNLEQAIEEALSAEKLSRDHSFYTSALGHIYALAGKKEKAIEQLKKLEMRAESGYVPSNYFAFVLLGLNRREEALDRLFEARRERAPWMIFLRADPRLFPLNGDPRFEDLCSILRPTASTSGNSGRS